MNDLSRREFLTATAIVLQGALMSWPLTARAEDIDLEIFSAEVGRKYLELFPVESNSVMLKRILHYGESNILDSLKADMHGNYVAGQTFRFNQWILSRTEGRLCALRALAAIPAN